MTLDKSLFSANCLARSSRFSLFKKARSSAELVGAADYVFSALFWSRTPLCLLGSLAPAEFASTWWDDQFLAFSLAYPDLGLRPAYLSDSAARAHDPKPSGACLTIRDAHISQYSRQALFLMIRHHLCSGLPIVHKCFQDKWWLSRRIVHLDPPGLLSFSYRVVLQRDGGIKDDV